MYHVMLFITKMKSHPSSDEVPLESKIRGSGNFHLQLIYTQSLLLCTGFSLVVSGVAVPGPLVAVPFLVAEHSRACGLQ